MDLTLVNRQNIIQFQYYTYRTNKINMPNSCLWITLTSGTITFLAHEFMSFVESQDLLTVFWAKVFENVEILYPK